MKFLRIIIITCFYLPYYAPAQLAMPIEQQQHTVISPVDQSFISADFIRQFSNKNDLFLRSHVGLIYDERENEPLYQRNAQRIMSIASLTKLMTAMVILDADLPMDEIIAVTRQDKDRILYSKSRLPYGSQLTRYDLLLIALLASENRAASALARTYPGGKKQFVSSMNKKARTLGLQKTKFTDPAGLRKNNVSTALELMKLVKSAGQYELIRKFTSSEKVIIYDVYNEREFTYGNTNRLVKKESWPIRLSKTGFTNEAGNCLIMQTEIMGRPVIIVLLNSWGKLSKYGDANRMKKWLLKAERRIKNSNKI